MRCGAELHVPRRNGRSGNFASRTCAAADWQRFITCGFGNAVGRFRGSEAEAVAGAGSGGGECDSNGSGGAHWQSTAVKAAESVANANADEARDARAVPRGVVTPPPLAVCPDGPTVEEFLGLAARSGPTPRPTPCALRTHTEHIPALRQHCRSRDATPAPQEGRGRLHKPHSCAQRVNCADSLTLVGFILVNLALCAKFTPRLVRIHALHGCRSALGPFVYMWYIHKMVRPRPAQARKAEVLKTAACIRCPRTNEGELASNVSFSPPLRNFPKASDDKIREPASGSCLFLATHSTIFGEVQGTFSQPDEVKTDGPGRTRKKTERRMKATQTAEANPVSYDAEAGTERRRRRDQRRPSRPKVGSPRGNI
ncbi:Protein of unknown function [Gryllus bimaculatus]|nr:Protein of unknown function [Gryllus bimaculatus]